MKRARYVALCVFSCALACGAAPFSVSAETVIGPDAEIIADTTWTKDGSPYVVQDWLTVNLGATLTIEPGVIVRFESDSLMDVLGTLLAQGTAEDPISFTSATGDQWYGINFENQETASSLSYVTIRYARTGITDYYSKDLSLSNISITDGKYGIEAMGSHLSMDTLSVENMSSEAIDIRDGSDVTLSNLTLKNVDMSVQIYFNSVADISNLLIDGASGEALAVYVGSHVRVASSTIKNVSNSYGAVEAFLNSSLDITGLTLENVSDGDALSVFNNSQMTVRDSSILYTDNYEVAAAFSSSTLIFRQTRIVGGTGNGVAIFGGGSIDMQDSVISEFTDGAGIADYGSRPDQLANSISLTRSEITGNAVGIGLYSDKSTYSISDNSIHNNTANGLESYGTTPVDVSNNYWGDPSGPYEDPDNLTGTGNSISFDHAVSSVIFSPWLTSDPLAPDPCAVPGACASNVLFLPGIEGSRLYEGLGCGGVAEEKLWEPIGESLWKILRGAGDKKVQKLFLDESGVSVCSDIYAKAGDVIDTVHGSDLYKSFIDEMNVLKSASTINDWKPVAYDWRLSLDDLLAKGIEMNGHIYYATTTATSTPYIEQTLRALAASSKTGKVTIVAHSNGGLVAKALLNELGGEVSKSLVDKIIMVGAPQSGAPVDIGALLYGYDQGISSRGIPILHSDVAQQLALNSPMAYHLLPSQKYFDSVMGDAAHPVARFAGDAYARELADYGNAIGTATELTDFLRASSLNSALIDYANSTHDALDAWVPPAGVEVSQIAGWGIDTVAGIEFYTLNRNAGVLAAATPVKMYRPIFIEDGDGTVPVPSALMMSESESVKRYWVDLHSYNKTFSAKLSHRDILEIPQFEDFIKDIITNSMAVLPAYISTTQPSPITDKKTLTFYLHLPLTLELADASGNVTGLAEDGSMLQDIPGSTYGEFGEVKYITVPEGDYELTMHGEGSGTFSLEMQERTGDTITASTTIANVPVTIGTFASMTILGGLAGVSPLSVDEDGDGAFTIIPVIGETVSYEPPAPELAPEPAPPRTSGGRGGRASHLPPAPAVSVELVPYIASTTSPIASSSPAVTSTVATPAPAPRSVATVSRVQTHAIAPPLLASVADSLPDFSQTASVYGASQQSAFKKLGTAVYNGLYGFWIALKKLF